MTSKASHTIKSLARIGCVSESVETLLRNDVRDIDVWNRVILVLKQKGDAKTSIEIYNKLIDRGIHPNYKTHANLLHCCIPREPWFVVNFFENEKNYSFLKTNTHAWAALLRAAGCLRKSNLITSTIIKMNTLKVPTDQVIVSTAIRSYCMCDDLPAALELYQKHTWNDCHSVNSVIPTLLSCCIKTDNYQVGRSLVENLKQKDLLSNDVRAAAASLFCSNGFEAVSYLNELFIKKGVAVPSKIYPSLISSCSGKDEWICVTKILKTIKNPSECTPAFMRAMQIALSFKGLNELEEIFNMMTRDTAAFSRYLNYRGVLGAKGALSLIDQMDAEGIPVNVIVFKLAVSLCEQFREFEDALLLRKMAANENILLKEY